MEPRKCRECGEELELITVNYDGIKMEPYLKCPRCRMEYDMEDEE